MGSFLSAAETDLGNTLIRMGRVTKAQIDEAQRRKGRHRRIGEQLVKDGACSNQDVEQALVWQERMRSGHEVEVLTEIIDGNLFRLRGFRTA